MLPPPMPLGAPLATSSTGAIVARLRRTTTSSPDAAHVLRLPSAAASPLPARSTRRRRDAGACRPPAPLTGELGGMDPEMLCSVLLPPLGVCLRHGCCSPEFWISVLLTILGYLPCVLYANYVICSVA